MGNLRSLNVLLLAIPLAFCSAPAGPWDAFNFAPASKTVWPTAVFHTEGSVTGADDLPGNKGAATLVGNGAWLALDFGLEVGGLISLNFDTVTPASSVNLAFTESSVFVRPDASDDGTQCTESMKYDGVFNIPAPLPSGPWTLPRASMRGGFRFLTIVSASDDPVTISNVSCSITFMPHVENLRDYAGYFYTNDSLSADADLLTKIWYAGAYTVQTNTVPGDSGRMWPLVPSPGWSTTGNLGVDGPIIVDGAKRDRTVWPGDMGIATPTQFVSTNDVIATRNALDVLFVDQEPNTGELYFVGPPIKGRGSDTYHAWTLVGARNYFMYTGDREWLDNLWTNYTKAVTFLTNKVDDSGLINITGLGDWARLGGGGHNAAGNAILYKVLTDAADLASHTDRTDEAAQYLAKAAALKEVYNTAFWDDAQGMYRDNPDTTLAAQDANSFAVLYNLTNTPDQATRVSEGLTKNWNDIGAVAPELPNTISPFASGFEIQAHFEAGQGERALDLIRREWGYMLSTNLSVQSTLIEGFTADGGIGYRSDTGYAGDLAYTSHAHGWSTGPTSALTFYLLGISLTAPQGAQWRFAPHTSGLPAAEGGFETPLGRFDVKWALAQDGSFTAELATPEGTEGVVDLANVVQTGTGPTRVLVDGQKVADGVGSPVSVAGGSRKVQIRSSTCAKKRK
ncbi:glycoside hydrolase family 78 protein [Exidia glandulosa HHB12029]|uniref:Glycoside hydrolase family 78 protein n=1 Tax=Exidia glandulosa HHB12029 TaxID=1314781 RepID=A0A165DJ01_EXIGL|nr:glycoside hydrolase family 78 protein [Exidia glandulosa HHB12029]